jgi:Mrp family chromosome partitioning ATPase
VHLVQSAVPPSSPSSPKPARNAIIGGIAGLLLGLALALAAEQLDGRLRRPDEVERELGLPLLATIPRSKALRGEVREGGTLGGAEAEAFRLLQSSLRHRAAGGEIRSVLVTSAGAGAGKTTIALRLASAAARTRGKVLLIEADLRRPRLGRMLGLPGESGLTTMLRAADEGAVFSVGLDSLSSPNGDRLAANRPRSFDLVVAGPGNDGATDLLDSERMRNFLRASAMTYELTVLDSAPPGLVADAVPLVAQVDGVILVARLGRDRIADLKRCKTELERLGVEPIGVVANFGPRVKNPYAS